MIGQLTTKYQFILTQNVYHYQVKQGCESLLLCNFIALL